MRRARSFLTGLVIATGLPFPARAAHVYPLPVYQIEAASRRVTSALVFRANTIEGAMLIHEGTVASLTCMMLVKARDGSDTLYLSAAHTAGSWYLRIGGIREGLGSAPGGISRSSTSADLCGAAAVPATGSYNYYNLGDTATHES